jgi:hypothetical protein
MVEVIGSSPIEPTGIRKRVEGRLEKWAFFLKLRMRALGGHRFCRRDPFGRVL